MKKSFLTIVVIAATVAFALAKGNDFASSLKDCSSYSESGVVQAEGMDVKTTKRIMGWQGDRCVYKETVNFAGKDTTITCKFSKPQITELTSVMNAYSIVQKYSNETIDTSSYSKVQNNPVVKAWNKYLQDASTCYIDGIN